MCILDKNARLRYHKVVENVWRAIGAGKGRLLYER